MSNIIVIGSLNMDLVLDMGVLPKIGETIEGNNINYLIGGKGANQAVAAARLGESVKFIGALGNDEFGKKIKESMQKECVDIESIKITENATTGLATILKTEKDNSIIIIKGANEECDVELLLENKEYIAKSNVLITQFEIPMETIEKSLEIAKENGVTTIVNPAPAKKIKESTFENIDYITPNETEFEVICGRELKDNASLEKEMLKWQEKYKTTLIVTRGSYGVSFIENNEVKTVKAIKVDAVDTTGAGDTFNGALGYCIGKKMKLEDAIKFASRAASLSVTKFGAQGGMPSLNQVEEIL